MSWKGFDAYWAKHPKDGRLVYRQISRNKRFYDLIKKYLDFENQNKLKILEVGCGTAIDSYYLRETSEADFFAMDSSEESIAQVQRLRPYFNKAIRPILSDIEQICFKDKTFDMIFSQGAMEHFMDSTRAYQEQWRVLKDGGILVVHVPQRYNPYSILLYFRLKIGNNWFGRERPYSIKDMQNIARRLKLDLIEIQGQDFFGLEICRFFNTQLISKEPAKHSVKLEGIHKHIDSLISFIEELLWQSLGRRVGKYIMMNIVGVFKKQNSYSRQFP